MKTGSYIGHQIAQIFHTGTRAAAGIDSEAKKKGESNWMANILGFLFVAIARAMAAVVLIPVHAILALCQPKQAKSDIVPRVIVLAAFALAIGVVGYKLNQDSNLSRSQRLQTVQPETQAQFPIAFSTPQPLPSPQQQQQPASEPQPLTSPVQDQPQETPPPAPEVYRTSDTDFRVTIPKTDDWFDTGIPVVVSQEVEVDPFPYDTSFRYLVDLTNKPLFPGTCTLQNLECTSFITLSEPVDFLPSSLIVPYGFLNTIKLKILADIPFGRFAITVKNCGFAGCTPPCQIGWQPPECVAFRNARASSQARARQMIASITIK